MLLLRRDIGSPCLIISAELGVGLADRPAWHCWVLTAKQELSWLMIHQETQDSTWFRVNVDDEVR